MDPLVKINDLTLKFSSAYDALEVEVTSLNSEIERIKLERIKAIKKQMAIVMDHRSRLKAEIEASPDLFVRPKTLILHGVKIGFTKNKGSLQIANEEQTIRLIKKTFPDMVDTYIKTVESPVKKMLEDLTEAELKKIGINIKGRGDAVTIKPVDSDIDKVMKVLFKDMDEEIGEVETE